MMVTNPWVCIDLDGTIMEDGHFPGFGKPRPGARKYLNKIRNRGIKIMVFTARTGITDLDGRYQNVNKVVNEILQWCEENDIPCDYVFPLPKPTFVLAFFDNLNVHVGPEKDAWKNSWDRFLTLIDDKEEE